MSDVIRKMAMRCKYFANLQNETHGVDYQEEFENQFSLEIIIKCVEAVVNDGTISHDDKQRISQKIVDGFGIKVNVV